MWGIWVHIYYKNVVRQFLKSACISSSVHKHIFSTEYVSGRYNQEIKIVSSRTHVMHVPMSRLNRRYKTCAYFSVIDLLNCTCTYVSWCNSVRSLILQKYLHSIYANLNGADLASNFHIWMYTIFLSIHTWTCTIFLLIHTWTYTIFLSILTWTYPWPGLSLA